MYQLLSLRALPCDVVPTDLDRADEMRLDDAVPIVNRERPDLYIAQARDDGCDLALFDPVGLMTSISDWDSSWPDLEAVLEF